MRPEGMRAEAKRRGMTLYQVRLERFEQGRAKHPRGGDGNGTPTATEYHGCPICEGGDGSACVSHFL